MKMNHFRSIAQRRVTRKSLMFTAVSLALFAVAAPASAASWWSSSPVSIGSTTLNVRSKGALGNGQHNDTAAFQAAIDALPASGGTVTVPAGTYMIDASRSINMRSHTRLQLAPTARLVTIPNSRTRSHVIKAWRVNNVEIVGGQIVGDRVEHRGASGEWGYGVNIQASRNVNVRGVTLSNHWGDGLYIGAIGHPGGAVISTDVTLDHVVSTNNRRQGLSIGPAQRVFIVDSTFSNTNGTAPQAGIDIEPQRQGAVKDVRIQASNLTGNQGNGLEVHDHVSNLVLTQSTVNGNHGFGVLGSNPTFGTISANQIRENGLDGVAMTNHTHDFDLAGNAFRYNSTRYFVKRGLPITARSSSPRDLQVGGATYRINVASSNTYSP